MKKEEVYINLQGKSEEYCGKVYDILNSNGEKTHVSKIEMHIYSNGNEKYHFSDGYWTDGDVNKAANKQEVTIEQLKEILQPMEGLKLEDVMIDCTILNNNAIKLIKTIFKTKGHGIRYIGKPFSQGKDIIMADCENPDHKKLISFAKFKKLFNNQTSLQEQLQKAQDEVERLQNLIEEENKIKVGDVCKFWNDNKNSFVIGVVQHVCENAKLKYETIFDCQFPNAEKITNPELIKLLENEIK